MSRLHSGAKSAEDSRVDVDERYFDLVMALRSVARQTKIKVPIVGGRSGLPMGLLKFCALRPLVRLHRIAIALGLVQADAKAEPHTGLIYTCLMAFNSSLQEYSLDRDPLESCTLWIKLYFLAHFLYN
jgi:hypothetical protein